MRPLLLFTSLLLIGGFYLPATAGDIDSFLGRQPQLSIDKKGKVRMVFGRLDSIFCAEQSKEGTSFSSPKFIARVHKMHLGMTRGPQIASSDQYTLVTAMDDAGNIHSFLLNHVTGKWVKQPLVNDVKGSAPEGLISIAADHEDNFYATWLDIRKKKNNNIYFSTLSGKSGKWSLNKLVYESPDGHVCECCKPSIAVRGGHVALMFRNWINGSRDLYVTKSFNKGKTFKPALKLGIGTWKLDGCPMDGGGIIIDEANVTHTAWQREGVLFYAKPGEAERKIGNGKSCSLAGTGDKLLVLLQDKKEVKYYDIHKNAFTTLGNGNFLKSIILPDGKMIFAWEEGGEIRVMNYEL